jgi:hypothetical protein
MDNEAVACFAVLLGELMVGAPEVESVNMSPVLVCGSGDGASVVDAPITLVKGRN